MLLWICDSFKQQVFGVKPQESRVERKLQLPSAPVCAHHPLHSTHLYRSRSRAKVLDSASGEGKPSDKVCESADALIKI